MRTALLALAAARAQEPVTLAYRSTDTLSRTTGTRISRTDRYAWLDQEKWAAYAKELYGPNNATINDMDGIDKALLPPNLQSLAEPARAVRRVRARYDIMCFNLRS